MAHGTHGVYRLIRKTEGVTFAGIDHGGPGQIIKEADGIIVIKFPRGSHWNGRGCSRGYHPARIYVLKKLDAERAEQLIDWDVERKKKDGKTKT